METIKFSMIVSDSITQQLRVCSNQLFDVQPYELYNLIYTFPPRLHDVHCSLGTIPFRFPIGLVDHHLHHKKYQDSQFDLRVVLVVFHVDLGE